LKRKAGKFMRRDGASNVTDDNAGQPLKVESPRVETEEGIVKVIRPEQFANA
jgi:hypothetical protein